LKYAQLKGVGKLHCNAHVAGMLVDTLLLGSPQPLQKAMLKPIRSGDIACINTVNNV